MAEPKTTKTLGYFNPNQYPVSLSLTEFGINATLKPGDYVVSRDEEGKWRKINDPALDRHCGPGRLSREVTRDGTVVPLIAIRSTMAPPVQHSTYVSSPDNPKGDLPPIPPAVYVPATNTLPIKAYSNMEEAYKSGKIRRPKAMKDDDGLDETEGAPFRGESIPDMKYADADVRNRRAVTKDKAGLQLTSETLVVPTNREAAPVPAGVKVLTAPGKAIEKAFSMDEIKDAEKNAPAPRFICQHCSPPKPFGFRSDLERHARAHHAAQADTIMAPYPKTVKPRQIEAAVAEQPHEATADTVCAGPAGLKQGA